MPQYTHFDKEGRPKLVDISKKSKTLRTAAAEGYIVLPDAVYNAISSGAVKKGDPFSLSELAGIMGAKKTSLLIPLCHSIRLDKIDIKCSVIENDKTLHIECFVATTESTGVEMEALVGVTTAALCFYDICKALDKGMIIKDVRLISKTGGKSSDWVFKREI